jgi:hypothetical protein
LRKSSASVLGATRSLLRSPARRNRAVADRRTRHPQLSPARPWTTSRQQ